MHSSNGYHLGKVCFLCRRPRHKKIECHLQKKLPVSIGREIADGNRKAQSLTELRSKQQPPSTAATKSSNLGVIFKNDIPRDDIAKELAYNRTIEAKIVETIIGAMATNWGVECNKTYEMGEGDLNQEMESNTFGNMLPNVEVDSSRGRASILGVGKTSSKASAFAGEIKDLNGSSPCIDKGVCSRAEIEMLTGELDGSTIQIVDGTNKAKVNNEENQDLTVNKDLLEGGGRQRGRILL